MSFDCDTSKPLAELVEAVPNFTTWLLRGKPKHHKYKFAGVMDFGITIKLILPAAWVRTDGSLAVFITIEILIHWVPELM